ncbi:Spy/CpxP family protein refolding chaperone [Phenylobacterium hankyongense]|nr:Spy/CpxP family protein refolding chaperone [Phenylobacterium hankyongense]
MILGGFCLGLMASAAAAAPQAVNAELIRLHDDLHLSEAQESAWQAYTTAIAPDPQAEARHRSTSELLPLVPTPRRIALIQATMAADQADFARQGAAVTAFYGQLSVDQQRTFDQDTLAGAGPGAGPGRSNMAAGAPDGRP